MIVRLPEAYEDFLRPARYKAVYGGRGSAKSRSFASILAIRAATEPLRILCGREIQKSIRDSVKRLLDDRIDEYGLRNRYYSTDTEIRGKYTDSLFIFAGFKTNPDTIKSVEGIDIFWGDEANKFSANSISVLIPTIRKPGSELWFSWNPEDPTDPVDAMFRGNHLSGAAKELFRPPPNSIIKKINYTENKWFPEVLKREMEWDRSRNPAKYKHVWEGEYRQNAEALVFTNWRVEEFVAPPTAEFRLGADWGFAVDPSVLIRCYIDEVNRRLFFDYEAYEIGCAIERLPQLFSKVPESKKWPLVADSARPETIDYVRRHGYPLIRPAKKGKGSVEDGIEFMKNYDIVVHPRCKSLINELSFYSWKTDATTNQVLPILQDKDNHVIDAARYAVESTRRARYRMMEVL